MSRKYTVLVSGFLALGLIPVAHAGGLSYVRDDNALANACGGGNGCWTNHLRLTDYDGDGDLDVLTANYNDFFGGGDNAQPLAIYENDGSGGFENVSSVAINNVVGSFRQIAMGDVDGDGDLDMYAAQGDGEAHALFINQGNGIYVDDAEGALPAEYPSSGAARMGDVDNDGDLDIFVADGYAENGPPYGRLYLNDGEGIFTESGDPIPDSISGSDIDDVELVDVDRDFDLDIIVNAHTQGIGALWLNDGTGAFSEGGSLAPPATGNFHYNVAPCDVDGDGDLDLWIDNIGGGFTEQLQINDGSGNFTDETAQRVSGNPGADDNGVVCADIDNDGDFDAIVLNLGPGERYLENDGDGNFTLVPGVFPADNDCTLWGEFGDIDGDGRIDLVTGQGECSSVDEVDLATDGIPVDDRAPVIIAIEAVPSQDFGEAPAVRFAVSDRTVTDEGARLDAAYALIPNKDPKAKPTVIDAMFMGGDLYRVQFPAQETEGTVTFQVCAEDRHGNVACSRDQTFDVGEGGGSDDTDGGVDSGDDSGGADETGVGETTGAGEEEEGGGDAPTADGTPTADGVDGADDGTGGTGTGDGGGADGDDEGCSCTTSGTPAGFPGLLLLGGLALRRRRRR